jgi:hypothetical protein
MNSVHRASVITAVRETVCAATRHQDALEPASQHAARPLQPRADDLLTVQVMASHLLKPPLPYIDIAIVAYEIVRQFIAK